MNADKRYLPDFGQWWQNSCQLFCAVEQCVSFRKRPKRIKGGVVKIVNQGSQRTSLWLSAAKAG